MFSNQCSGLLSAFLCATSLGTAAELWISPEGDDRGPGTETRALRTFAGAQQAVRHHPKRGTEAITVRLKGGTYYLPETLVFTAEDSGSAEAPVTYTAAEGATVVLSGGQRVELDWRPFQNGIMQAGVAEGFTSDQLFVAGVRQHMARFPNYDPGAQYFQGFGKEATAPERVKRWADPKGGFVHAMHRALWGDMHWQITGKTDEGELLMEGGWQNNRQMGAHPDYRFVENIFEELDAPGEWFLDQGKDTLYFHPPEGTNLSTTKIEAVRLPHLVEFRGDEEHPVRFIHLERLTLTHTARTFMDNKEPLLRSDWTTYRGGAVFYNGAEDCAIRDCFINQAGSNAVFVNNYNRRIAVTGCHILDAGASAISFVGDPDSLRSPLFEYHETQELAAMDKGRGPNTSNYPADCLVEECLLVRNGRFEKQTAGVNICTARSITVRHCSIYDCPRAGINLCNTAFGGHLIEANDVFDTVKETGDHGSFNSWGRERFWHPKRDETVKWLERHPDLPGWDVIETITIRGNRWRCDHGWDIDLDDGSSHFEIYNNLCLAGGIKLREGYDRRVFNNIMVDYTFCPHVWYPNCRSSFAHNIIFSDRYAPAGMRTTDQVEGIDHNLVHQAGVTEARPAEVLRKFGADRQSIVADALFVAPLSGDYRVKEGSPALKLGFKNFPMDRFGVTVAPLKRIARTAPLPGSLEAAGIRSGGWGRKHRAPQTADWLGAQVRGIRDEGEMSAVGLGDKRGVLVTSVPAGSPAAKLDLRENDVIREIDGEPVAGLANFSELYLERDATSALTLKLWRNQADHTIQLNPE